MKLKIPVLLAIIFQLVSCTVYDKNYKTFIEIPELYLMNKLDNKISVETYYYDKKTGKESLWESKKIEINPSETKQIMDWVYPIKLIIFKEEDRVFDYSGRNDQLNENSLNTGGMKIISSEVIFDDTKYEYNKIPYEIYDFNWLGDISEENIVGLRYNLVYSE